ncbi:MAG TPA: tetratricopeptide repeat protein [Pirellulales bacterium]|jgi:tetratricopeptide (TPR) repeat protein
MRAPVHTAGLVSLLMLMATHSWAGEEKENGQEDLDQAIETKLSARSVRDLNVVISQCESALDKGLSEKNQGFAKQLLASSLLERGSAVCEMIFGRGAPPPQWPQMRQIGLADLERALQYDPTMVDAYLLVSKLQALPGGDRKRAMSATNEIVRLTADDPAKQSEALLMRSSIQDTPEQALADLNDAAKLAPQDPKILRTRGAMKLSLKDADGAVADFDAALALDPEDATTHEAKALTLATQTKFDEARASLDRALELAPDSVEILLQRGRVNMLAGKNEAGLADFSEVLRIDRDNVPALLLRAEAAIPDHLDEAMEDLNKALDLRPGMVPALRQRAALLAHAHKYLAAVGDLELARKLEPDDQAASLQLAAVYAADGKMERSMQLYGEILQADPKNWQAFRGRGDLYLTSGKQREAISDFEQALALKGDDSGVLNNLAWVLATSPDASLRDGKRAVDLAKKACEETEYKQAHILSTLAAGYAEIGDFSSAVEWSKKALDLGDDVQKADLSKELESYEASKPWRELQTAAADSTKPAESTRR